MRRVKYEVGPVKVLVDIPEEMFQEMKEKLGAKKMRQAIATLATATIQEDVEQ